MTGVLLAAVLASAAAAAFGPGDGPCGEDVVRFCGGSVARGLEAVQGCLAARKDELSGFCVAAGGGSASGPRRDAADYQAACGADAERFCPASRGGWSVTMKCLTLHNQEVSPGCRGYADGLRRKYEEVLERRAQDDCAAEAKRYCRGLSFSRGLADCLTPRFSRLSPRCRQGLDGWRRVNQLRRAETLKADGPARPAPR